MRRIFRISGATLLVATVLLVTKTYHDIHPIDAKSLSVFMEQARFQVVDRNGVPLAVSYQNSLNAVDNMPLYEMPPLLKKAFIAAEDKRFFEHGGIDWQARAAALWQDAHAMYAVRGASTITEQVVRILHPRPRTLWSRWVEGFEAAQLERHADKAQILEFYLNQVPYAANRRGIGQAAHYYFNRDVATLTTQEILALAVLPRAPSAYDLYSHPGKIHPAIARLAKALRMTDEQQAELAAQPFVLSRPTLSADAGHFVGYIRENVMTSPGKVTTTLDSHLQEKAQQSLSELLRSLKGKQVHNGAVMVVDHTTGEILVWAVAGDQEQAIDAVRTPRQPGSSMKPFLYGLALDSGWTPATIIHDEPMAEEVNYGMHRFNNYSHMFYGKVTLRGALGNSLNIPAIHTIDYVGVSRYLSLLHRMGMTSLTQPADFYDEGLALGDGEVTLFEMVQGYTALANRGLYRPLSPLLHAAQERDITRVYSEEAASLIGNILSDPWARELEFGVGSVLNLPVQTAVKTGTSTNYHDAWALGYNSYYVVGVWMGNLDGTPMNGITGSTGPALVLRNMFSSLAEEQPTSPLYLSPRLVMHDVCTPAHDSVTKCFKHTEYFIAGTEPSGENIAQDKPVKPVLLRPADGLLLAYDPRIPADKQAFEFVAQGVPAGRKASWLLNEDRIATTDSGHYLWPIKRGNYRLTLEVAGDDGELRPIDSVRFYVK